jgi:hypothetical protein
VNNVGLAVENLTNGTNNTNVLIGTNVAPTGNFSIYNQSSYNNVFAGNLRIGSTVAPTVALDVTGAALISTTLGVTGDTTLTGTLTVANITPTANLTIGTSDTTGTLLVLDTKTDAGDPTGVEGGMYYNSSSRNFRCFVSGAWRNCIGGVVFANTSVPGGNTITNTTTETNFASNYSIPANDCQPGRVYRVTANGVYSTPAGAGTMDIRLKFGTTVLTAHEADPSSNSTTNFWNATFDVICITAGGSGTVEASGYTQLHDSNTNIASFVGSDNTTTITTDTTTGQTLQISAQWGTASASRTITLRQLIIEAL